DNSVRTAGLVGLGAGPLSLVSQLAIISGDGVVSTPLIIKPSEPTFYYLNLEGISVGQKTIQTGQTNGNIIIDSGTTLTYLEQSFFDDFVTSVKEVIGANLSLEPKNMLLLYENNLVCLAVVPSNIQGISILGNVAQVDFQVEYDLQGKKLSFVPSNCAKN
ncbi:aspartic proteinase CDR1-like, partial [Trifolium medium]|nr:aspartic proteinase CDR1-like [Trifolium medium]